MDGKTEAVNWKEFWKDLDDLCAVMPVQNHYSLDSYLKSTLKLYSQGITKLSVAKSSGDFTEKKDAFILLRRFANMIVLTIPKHKNFSSMQTLQKKEYDDMKKACPSIIESLELLKKEFIAEEAHAKNSLSKQVEFIEPMPVQPIPTQYQPQAILHLPPSYSEATEQNAPQPAATQIPDSKIISNASHFSKSHPLYRKMADFVFIRDLGVGSFGVCKLMKDIKSGTLCVIKQISFQNTKDIMLISQEIALLRKLDHPNIIQYYTSFLDENENWMCLVMEFADRGDLSDWMEARELNKSKIPLSTFLPWIFQIIDGMAYVHSLNIIHRDLKPSNIFLSSNGEPQGETVLKIGDFGLSYQLIQSKGHASTRAGTMWAPEIFAGEMPGKPADVYAVGCILYELCMGRSKPASSLLLAEKKGPLLDEFGFCMSKELQQLLTNMLLESTTERFTFEQCREFFEKNFASYKSTLKSSAKFWSGTTSKVVNT